MNTWSIESAFVRAGAAAAVALQRLIDAVTTAERITRPPRGCIGCGKSDCGEKCANAAYYRGAEQLAEREAEEEVSEPIPDGPPLIPGVDVHLGPRTGPCPQCNMSGHCGPYTCTQCEGSGFVTKWLPNGAAETPNPAEPALIDDELVEVRQLIEERFGEEQNPFIVRLAERVTAIEQLAQIKRLRDSLRDHKSSAPVNQLPGTGAEPAESVAEYMARAERVESGYIIHDHPVEECGIEHCLCKSEWRHGGFLTRVEHERAAAEHLTPVEVTQRRLAEQFPQLTQTSPSVKHTPGIDGEPTSPAAGPVTPAGDSGEVVSPFPLEPASPRPDLATWLEPAVMTVLSDHIPHPSPISAAISCSDVPSGARHHTFQDWSCWQEHTSKLIAEHIAQALPDYPGQARAVEQLSYEHRDRVWRDSVGDVWESSYGKWFWTSHDDGMKRLAREADLDRVGGFPAASFGPFTEIATPTK